MRRAPAPLPPAGKKFLIHVSSYHDDIGGVIAAHKLCHCLNQAGYPAWIQPHIRHNRSRLMRALHYAGHRFPVLRALTGHGFLTNPALDTPLLPFGIDRDPQNTIAVYPETIRGNPLGAGHVVRWFMHRPGFHTGETEFGRNEFHIDFNQFLVDYDPGENYLSPNRLFVVHFPFNIYNLDGALPAGEREGIAYCLRKGKPDPAIDLAGATCIDGLPHAEVARVLKRVKYFYSFDPYTAYSHFAALCGAISFVLPPEGMSRDAWYARDIDRYGVGFGLADEDWARSTQARVLPTLREREAASLDAVKRFAAEALAYFGGNQAQSPAAPPQPPGCLVFLPHSYSGRGPAESCVRLLDALPSAGIDTRLHLIRARRPAGPGVAMIEAAPPLLRRLPFRLVRGIGTRRLHAGFARAIDAADPGSIAWFWPDVPIELVRRAKARGLVCLREMINSPLAHAKPILDAAYRAAGLPPGHGITDAAVAAETEELGLNDYLFASNPEVEAALLALGIPADRILPTSFGWVKARFAGGESSKPAREDRPFRACFVGLMNVRKGVPTLLDAWSKAGIAGELWLAGAIEPCLRPMVDAAIASGTVRHFGHVDDVAALYRACDAFVFPTHEEGGPQVTYEAAACGLPAITTAMGAARLVEHGKTGLIVQAGDADGLAAALRVLANEPEFVHRLGHAARTASARFAYDAVGVERASLLVKAAGGR